MIAPLAAFDAATVVAIGVLALGVIGAVITPLMSRSKTREETQAIATKTTLEVNEGLREELKDLRAENQRLRKALRQRDERIDALETRVGQLRQDIDVLEAEIVALRRSRVETP